MSVCRNYPELAHQDPKFSAPRLPTRARDKRIRPRKKERNENCTRQQKILPGDVSRIVGEEEKLGLAGFLGRRKRRIYMGMGSRVRQYGMRCPKMTPKHISRRRERQKSRGRKEGRNEEASGGVFGAAGCGKWGRGDGKKRKRWVFGRWGEVWAEEEEWRRRREKGRKEGRRTVARSLLLLLRPSAPPKKNDCCRLQCRPTVKTPKRAYTPEMGLAPVSGFTLYPSFLSSLFFAPPGCPACTLAGYKRLCGSLQHFFYSGKKEDMSVRRQCAPSPPNGGRELEGKSKVMPNHLLVQQMR